MRLLRKSLAGQLCPRPVAFFAEPGVVKWPGSHEVLENGKPGRRVRFVPDETMPGNGDWVYEE